MINEEIFDMYSMIVHLRFATVAVPVCLMALCLSGVLPGRQLAPGAPLAPQDDLLPAEARAIAREAYIYGFPMVDGYKLS